MGDIGSASSAVRLHELCVDAFATKTRVVLEGIDRLLVYSIPMRLRFRISRCAKAFFYTANTGGENVRLSGITTRGNPLPGLLAHWKLLE